MASPGRIAQTLELVTTTIPDDLWSELLRPLRNPALAELKPVRRVWSAQVRRGERED